MNKLISIWKNNLDDVDRYFIVLTIIGMLIILSLTFYYNYNQKTLKQQEQADILSGMRR